MAKKKMFLICPVRHSELDYSGVVEMLDKEYEVHWPPRDTNQKDKHGFRICSDNLKAIEKADVVGIIWDGKSQGSLFDAGMAFALRKTLIIIQVPPATPGKSFQNMFRQWELNNDKLREIITRNPNGKPVYIRADLVGKHDDYSLCTMCDRYSNDRMKTCTISKIISSIFKKDGTRLPVWECRKFVKIKPAKKGRK